MSEMVERVARAFAASHYPDKDTDFMWRHMVPDALAAIAAMREPTKAILEAGNIALENAIDSGIDSRTDTHYTSVSSTAPYEVFVAMIDAALEPERVEAVRPRLAPAPS